VERDKAGGRPRSGSGKTGVMGSVVSAEGGWPRRLFRGRTGSSDRPKAPAEGAVQNRDSEPTMAEAEEWVGLVTLRYQKKAATGAGESGPLGGMGTSASSAAETLHLGKH